MLKQMSKYFKKLFSKFQCGFRKSFSAQQYLLSMLEKWKSPVDNQKRLVQEYLTNSKQRTRLNSAYSSWEEILFGVPQRSI